MKIGSKISGEQRRAAIIEAARKVFVEKGFSAATTRELAEAAGVSEALVFKHFPSKEALYAAILRSCFEDEKSKITDVLRSLQPSTAALMFLVHDLVSHILRGQPDEEHQPFFRLVLRSLMDGGEFTRLAIQGKPARWVRKVEECIEAARAAGDMVDGAVPANLGGWFVHQLISGFLLHALPAEPVIDYGVSGDELVKQVTWFCLRGMGLKEEVIQRGSQSEGFWRGVI
jgi:AcrR family transcriptional regulator